jgi:hypothetical protein
LSWSKWGIGRMCTDNDIWLVDSPVRRPERTPVGPARCPVPAPRPALIPLVALITVTQDWSAEEIGMKVLSDRTFVTGAGNPVRWPLLRRFQLFRPRRGLQLLGHRADELLGSPPSPGRTGDRVAAGGRRQFARRCPCTLGRFDLPSVGRRETRALYGSYLPSYRYMSLRFPIATTSTTSCLSSIS